MKAFITGGTGFIGSHIVDKMLQRNFDEVKCLVRTGEKWIEGKRFTSIKGDLFNLPVIDDALKDIDLVIHSAGLTKSPSKRELERTNVEATENLLRLAIKNKISKVVILSSQAASGPSKGLPVRESDPMNPVSTYGVSKKNMEEMIHNVATSSISVTIVRPSSVYGPREEDIFNFFRSASFGYCPIVGENNLISLAHVDDIVQVVLKAADYKHAGVETFFATSDRAYNWLEIKEATEEAMNKKLRVIKLSPSFITGLSGIIENVASYIGKYPVINREKAREMILEWQCSSEKSKNILGYRQKVDLYDGIKKTIDWYKSHDWL